MRIAAIVVGLLGAVGSGYLGYKWVSDVKTHKAEVAYLQQLNDEEQNERIPGLVAEVDRATKFSYAMLGASVLAVVGVALVSLRQGVLAAAVFGVAFATPLALGADPTSLILTFALPIAAVLSFFATRPAATGAGAEPAGVESGARERVGV